MRSLFAPMRATSLAVASLIALSSAMAPSSAHAQPDSLFSIGQADTGAVASVAGDVRFSPARGI